jgi:hypothetical protein
MQLKTYQSVLLKAHEQIRRTAQDSHAMPCCWFLVPSFVLGLSKYEHGDCIAYLVRALTENGFQVRYYHPNLIFICWNHVVPKYARDELKRAQGIDIDQFGNLIVDEPSPQPTINSATTNAAVTPLNTAKTKPTDTYKPSGKLLYSAKMFHQLAERVRSKNA